MTKKNVVSNDDKGFVKNVRTHSGILSPKLGTAILNGIFSIPKPNLGYRYLNSRLVLAPSTSDWCTDVGDEEDHSLDVGLVSDVGDEEDHSLDVGLVSDVGDEEDLANRLHRSPTPSCEPPPQKPYATAMVIPAKNRKKRI